MNIREIIKLVINVYGLNITVHCILVLYVYTAHWCSMCTLFYLYTAQCSLVLYMYTVLYVHCSMLYVYIALCSMITLLYAQWLYCSMRYVYTALYVHCSMVTLLYVYTALWSMLFYALCEMICLILLRGLSTILTNTFLYFTTGVL